ncbi:MAG: ATP-binding protein [Bacteroidales bacterium]|nr:ATP-binding protein [Bacteroidales bacterium]
MKTRQDNPFKFGTVVEDEYFTDRTEELKIVKSILHSENHLVLISPRRYGKTSLVLKSAKETSRPLLFLNLESVTDKKDFAVTLLKKLLALYPFEKLKFLLKNFRFVPTLSMSALGDSFDISFITKTDDNVILEDVFALMSKISDKENKLIVVFDEFQQVDEIDKNLSKLLRSIMQLQQNINFVMLGSQESMMRTIFEKKKSPFYHFAELLTLKKIPREDFYLYLQNRLSLFEDKYNIADITEKILDFTDCHPYYTQKLAFNIWELLKDEMASDDIVQTAIDYSNEIHDMDYERLWSSFKNTDKKVLKYLSVSRNTQHDYSNIGIPISTVFSSLKRMAQSGILIKENRYEIDDPFFAVWIKKILV